MEKKYSMSASYKWMKQYMKDRGYNSFVDYTVYYCIKHNFNEEQVREYAKNEAHNGRKCLMNRGTIGIIKFIITNDTRKMFPRIHDELFELEEKRRYDSTLNKECIEYRYKIKGKSDLLCNLTGDLKFNYGSGNYWKDYVKDSDIHPIKVSLWWCVNKQSVSEEAQLGYFVDCCVEMWQIIKRLDNDIKLKERTINKKLELSTHIENNKPIEIQKDKKESNNFIFKLIGKKIFKKLL